MSYFIKFTILAFFAYGLVFAQTSTTQLFKFSGKVINFAGEPIPRASVKLKKAGKATITAADGSFMLTNDPTAINGTPSRFGRAHFATLHDGHLEIQVSQNAQVFITVFSIGGKILYNKTFVFKVGLHTVSIPVAGKGVYLICVRMSGQTVLLKACSLEKGLLGRILALEDYSTRVLTKRAMDFAFHDTLLVSKAAYLDYQTLMFKTDSDGMLLRMASTDHPKVIQEFVYTKADHRECHAGTVLELPSGELMCAFFGGHHEGSSDQKIYLCRKKPGKEWTKPAVVIGQKAGNPSLFQSFSGKLMLFDGWHGRMQTSTDEGKTWSKLRKVGGGCSGPEKNKCVQLEDGTILAPAHDVTLEMSKDDGETWSRVAKIGGGIQPTIMRHTGGRLQTMCRTSSGTIGVSWSDDNGKTWTKGKSVLPQNNSGLDAVTLRDSRQLLVYNHSLRNDASNGRKGRCILNVSVSKDGENWRAALLLNHLPENFDQVQFSYPAVIQGRDGLVHVVHTWHRLRMKHVVINPYKLTDDVTVAMPDGKWPTSGPLSVAEFPDSKREDPRKMP